VSVTVVGVVTSPVTIRNSARACVPGNASDGGTGAMLGWELARATVAPPDGTPAVSCTSTNESSPL
jgi:hypothetical protein